MARTEIKAHGFGQPGPNNAPTVADPNGIKESKDWRNAAMANIRKKALKVLPTPTRTKNHKQTKKPLPHSRNQLRDTNFCLHALSTLLIPPTKPCCQMVHLPEIPPIFLAIIETSKHLDTSRIFQEQFTQHLIQGGESPLAQDANINYNVHSLDAAMAGALKRADWNDV
jgi:hypothetical protein